MTVKIITKPIFIDVTGAADMLSVSESTIQKLTREDSTFPKPRLISAKRTGYLLREIEEWGENRPVSNLAPPPNTGGRRGRVNHLRQAAPDDQKAA